MFHQRYPVLRILPLILLPLFFCSGAQGQKVGLVLSGGGANGLAHVGVLKALEEHNVPIDFISGASMGAIVGGLYAAGYSPAEIESLLTSEEFIRDIQGEHSEDAVFFLKKPAPDASWITPKIAWNEPLANILPTNVISPYALDIKMLETYGGANAVSGENFDSLFVPFRCVAANVRKKEMKLFKSGQLNAAVRASSTYPFYYKAVLTDGELLYDGGLINNFPIDVLIREFNPDFIIGSNVSYNFEAPAANDLLSQIKNMLVSLTDYSLKGRSGIIIEPSLSTSAFDFSDPQAIINEGYKSTFSYIDSIKSLMSREADPLLLSERRQRFTARKPPIVLEDIQISGVNAHQGNHIRHALVRKEEVLTIEILKPRFLRLFNEPQIKYIYPGIKYNPSTNKYILKLDVEKDKDIFVKIGGNLSSKPINTGYLSVRYNYLRKSAYFLEVSTYFGKYYESLQAVAHMQTAWRVPVYFEIFSTLNRWDYFKNRATFFEELKPSFIIQAEKFGGFNIGIPARFKGRVILDVKQFEQKSDYYLLEEFSRTDTADVTKYSGTTAAISYERNTLNRRQYASKGTYLKVQSRYLTGFEKTYPGSTALTDTITIQKQDWFSFSLRYDNYFKTLKNLTLGFHAHGHYNTQYFFGNYKSSLLFSPAYQPTPESRTLFLDNYRANKFVGIGLSGILNFSKNIDYRLEAYLFQPINELQQTPLQRTTVGKFLGNQYNIFSSSLVYHTPFGPLSATLNYYQRPGSSLSFVFNFGYIIFNKTVQD